MSVRASLLRFPVDAEAQEACGIPWGVAVTPFSSANEHGVSPAYGSDGHLLPRCENCWAYFNTYCELEQWAWTCALCGSLNGLPSHAIQRYSQSQPCAEMSSSFVDLELPGLPWITLMKFCICVFVITLFGWLTRVLSHRGGICGGNAGAAGLRRCRGFGM